MDAETRNNPTPRVYENPYQPGTTIIEPGFERRDGPLSVKVEWDERVQQWAAMTLGIGPIEEGMMTPTCAYGYGSTQLDALAQLTFALSATVEAMHQLYREEQTKNRGPSDA